MSRRPHRPDITPAEAHDPAKRLRDLLTPAARKHIDLMEQVKSCYIATERDDRLRAEMQEMLDNVVQKRDRSRPYGADNRREGTAVAIIADSGAGKTRAMLHYLKDNPAFPRYGEPDGGCQLITVGVKAPCILRQLGMATLRAAGYRTRRELRENEAWPQAHFQIAEQNILFVHYEEMQRVIQQKSADERTKIVETLTGLMTDLKWPLHLILSGLPEMKTFLEAHDTLRRRVRFVEFAPVDPKLDRKQIEQAIRQYEKVGRVSLRLIREAETSARLCHAAARQLGLIFELTVGAIGNCLKAGRRVVTLQDYSDAYASRTLEPIELNPFEVDHWETIDTSIIQRPLPDMAEPIRGKPQRRRSKDNA